MNRMRHMAPSMVFALVACLGPPVHGSAVPEIAVWSCALEPGQETPEIASQLSESGTEPGDEPAMHPLDEAFPVRAWAFNTRNQVSSSGGTEWGMINEAVVCWFESAGALTSVLRLSGDSEAWVSENGATVLHTQLLANEGDDGPSGQPMTTLTCEGRDGVVFWEQVLPHGRYRVSPSGDLVVRMAADYTDVYTAQGRLLAHVAGQCMESEVSFSPSGEFLLLFARERRAPIWEDGGTVAVCLDKTGTVQWRESLGRTHSACATWLTSSESMCIGYAPSPARQGQVAPSVLVILDEHGEEVARREIKDPGVGRIYVGSPPDGARILVALQGHGRLEPNRLLSYEAHGLALEYEAELPSGYVVAGVAAGRRARAAVAVASGSELSGAVLFFEGSACVGRVEAAAATLDWISASGDGRFVIVGRRWVRGGGKGFVQVLEWR